jgi:hypothetical protein
LGSFDQIPKLAQEYKVDELFFMLNTTSHKNVLLLLSRMRSMAIEARLIPDNLDYMLGKSKVDYLEDIPILDIDLLYQSGWNKFVKKSLDLVGSLFLLTFLFPLLLKRRGQDESKLRSVYFYDWDGNQRVLKLFHPFQDYWWHNLTLLLKQVLKGELSLVGAPLTTQPVERDYDFNSGITGLAQINQNRIFKESDIERFDLHYLQNYSIWMDIDILVKALTARNHPLVYENEEDQTDKQLNSTLAL